MVTCASGALSSANGTSKSASRGKHVVLRLLRSVWIKRGHKGFYSIGGLRLFTQKTNKLDCGKLCVYFIVDIIYFFTTFASKSMYFVPFFIIFLFQLVI